MLRKEGISLYAYRYVLYDLFRGVVGSWKSEMGEEERGELILICEFGGDSPAAGGFLSAPDYQARPYSRWDQSVRLSSPPPPDLCPLHLPFTTPHLHHLGKAAFASPP